MKMKQWLKKGLTAGLCFALGISGSTAGFTADSQRCIVQAAESVDILNYDSNRSATEFVINDCQGMEKLAALVNEGTDDFAGDTITLNADLAYNSSVMNNHVPIGTKDFPFKGTFDGRFYTISGININSSENFIGLFGLLECNAKISNVILDSSIIISYLPSNVDKREDCAGGIAGKCSSESDGSPVLIEAGAVKNGWSGSVASIIQNRVPQLSNCYWLEKTAADGICTEGSVLDPDNIDLTSVSKKTDAEMKAAEFVEQLNGDAGDGAWEADTKNLNNGYPVLRHTPYSISDLSGNTDDNETDDGNEVLDHTPVDHLFTDYSYDESVQADNSTITLYAPSTVKEYSSSILYTDITASYIYTFNKGKLTASTGKVIVGITLSDAEPKIVKGKIVDESDANKEASKIASASIKSGQITVKSKSKAGRVYLWVMDTGSKGTSACCPVTVKKAPTALPAYSVPDTDLDFKYGETKTCTKTDVNVGSSTNVYLYPVYKSGSDITKTTDCSYTAKAADNVSEYFSVAPCIGDPFAFTIYAKKFKVDGKKISGKITFTCDQNGRKVTLTATAVNQVNGISIDPVSNMTRKSGDYALGMNADYNKTITGKFQITPTAECQEAKITDTLKIYAMGSEDGFDQEKFAKGTVSIQEKCKPAQKRITAKINTDKKTITISAQKRTNATTYFLAVYNTKHNSPGKGYAVISVTAK